MIGAILFPAGVAVVLLKGEAFVAPIVGSLIVVVAMALFTDRVPDLAGLIPARSRGQPLRQSPPSPFEPIHGIVRQTDSLRLKRAQHMKSHAQTIENQR